MENNEIGNIEEQKHLDNTLSIIEDEIKEQEMICEKGIDHVRELSKYHWETKSEMDDVERASDRFNVNHEATLTNKEINRLRKLIRAKENPFFGKIVVDFDGDKEVYYIGYTTIIKDNDVVISDWRSPISSLFYNSRLGDTSYKAPMGMVSCNLEQRKQIKIKNINILKMKPFF